VTFRTGVTASSENLEGLQHDSGVLQNTRFRPGPPRTSVAARRCSSIAASCRIHVLDRARPAHQFSQKIGPDDQIESHFEGVLAEGVSPRTSICTKNRSRQQSLKPWRSGFSREGLCVYSILRFDRFQDISERDLLQGMSANLDFWRHGRDSRCGQPPKNRGKLKFNAKFGQTWQRIPAAPGGCKSKGHHSIL